jgi:DNA-binding NarL/FixJ family response regulator
MSSLPPRTTVLLVDDHAVVREGYHRLLERDPELQVIGEAGNAAEALHAVQTGKPDVVVLDIALPGVSGIEVLRRILAHRPEARVLMFSMYQDGIYANRALQAGARGFVSKASAPELLVKAVRAVARGEQFISPDVQSALERSASDNQVTSSLSPRELEVLRLLTQGFDIERIAERLGLSPKTAANHQSSIKQKLGAGNALQLLLIAQQLGLAGGP